MKKDLLKKALVLLPAFAMVACGGGTNEATSYDPWAEEDDSVPSLPQPSTTEIEQTSSSSQTSTAIQSSSSSSTSTITSTPTKTEEGGETVEEHLTYIDLGEEVTYDGNKGTRFVVNNVTYNFAVKLTLPAGTDLPGADKFSHSNELYSFKHLYADDENTAVSKVPATSGTVLKIKWDIAEPPATETFTFNITTGEETVKKDLVAGTNEGEFKLNEKVALKAGDKITASEGETVVSKLYKDVNNFGKFTEAEDHILVNESGAGLYNVIVSKTGGINLYRGEPNETDTYKVEVKRGDVITFADMTTNPAEGKENEVFARVSDLKALDEIRVWCGTDVIVDNTHNTDAFEKTEVYIRLKAGNAGSFDVVATKTGDNVWYTYQPTKPDIGPVAKDRMVKITRDDKVVQYDLKGFDNDKKQYTHAIDLREFPIFRPVLANGNKIQLKAGIEHFDVDEKGYISAKPGHAGVYNFYIKENGEIYIGTFDVLEIERADGSMLFRGMFDGEANQKKMTIGLNIGDRVRVANGAYKNTDLENGDYHMDELLYKDGYLVALKSGIFQFYYKTNTKKSYIEFTEYDFTTPMQVMAGEKVLATFENAVPDSNSWDMAYQYHAGFEVSEETTITFETNGKAIVISEITGEEGVVIDGTTSATIKAGTHHVYLKVFANKDIKIFVA